MLFIFSFTYQWSWELASSHKQEVAQPLSESSLDYRAYVLDHDTILSHTHLVLSSPLIGVQPCAFGSYRLGLRVFTDR